MKIIVSFVLWAAMAVGVSANEVETDIVAAVRGNEKSALALLTSAVNINSGTMNFAGVREVGAVFGAELEALDFAVEWIDGTPFQRAGHLVATRHKRGPKILLIGHLDTVFAADSPFQVFRQIDASRAAGPGITDMKGGNVVLIEALRALLAVDALDGLSITVVLTGDEEKRGSPIELAVAPLVAAARWADIAIGFEDGDGDPKTAVIARRGSSRWHLRITAKPAHSSQIFREDIGSGAIFEAARILNDFRLQLSTEKNLTFNPGLIVGGTDISLNGELARGTAYGKDNVIAQNVQVDGDIRALSSDQREIAKQRMRAILAENLPHSEAYIEFQDNYPPMAPSEGNRRLLARYDEVSRDLGFGAVSAVDPRKAGAADISFAADYVEMAMDGIGLMGWGGHTVDEIADLTTLTMQSQRAAVLLYRLSVDGRDVR